MKSTVRSGTLLLLLGCAGPILAESKTYTLVVGPCKDDRAHAVVRVWISLPPALAKLQSITLKGPDGQIPAQLTDYGLLARDYGLLPLDKEPDLRIHEPGAALREIHFVLPKLVKNTSIELQATISTDAPAKAKGFNVQNPAADLTDLRFGDLPVLQYVHPAYDGAKHDLTFKPFHHVFDADGKKLLTNGTGGRYPHHRGIFFGYNRISYGEGKKVDNWHGRDGAHQVHEKFLGTEAGPVLGRLQTQIAWRGPKDELFAIEERELAAYRVPGGTLIDFATRVKTKAGKVLLDGDPQHSGVQFRATNEVNDNAAKTYFLRPDGPDKPGVTRNWDPKTKEGPVNLVWDAMCFAIGDQRWTVAYLDLPTNPKEARFGERDYGRFGSYFTFELTDKRDLQARYRFWLQRGEMTVPQVAALSEDFVKPVPVKVKGP